MGKLTQCAIPYKEAGLAPVISTGAFTNHYVMHHRAYVEKANKLLAGSEWESLPMLDIVRAAWESDKTLLFNNVAQAWNHDFYWLSMRPGAGGEPVGRVGDRIKDAFGGYKEFRKEFLEVSTSQFGSGWVWLVLDKGALKITKTSNAENPHCFGQKALLTIDVWEHAYYLDWQSRRADYVSAWLDRLANWHFVDQNLG